MKSILLTLVLAVAAALLVALNLQADEPSAPVKATRHTQTIVLGSGCFWGAEKGYEALPGVIDAVSGYADGRGLEPSYKAITRPEHRMDPNNFAEVVKVTYDTGKISTEALLKHFFEHHDPTQANRQGNDIGTQYRSTILTSNDEQADIARRLQAQYQTLLSEAGYGEIKTVIKPLDQFHPAETYHQDYLAKNPNGYCPDHSTGVTFAKVAKPAVDNSALMKGQQILVLEAEFCPYCKAFRKDVADAYRGDIPMSFRMASGLDGLELETPTWATPTIFFLQDGKEVAGHQGYMNTEEFYKALGLFKLGDSEAFHVAFNQGTDNRFCRQYELFKHTPEGVFTDKLSGAPLFDTRYRFNSGTGWLSFTRPVEGETIERADNSHGMARTEVISRSSGIHLGHVFNDGPNGQPRYCINATVLDFKAR